MRALSDWIDFMEGEGTVKQLERMSLLLKHSIADQMILDNLRRLRRALKKSDPAVDKFEQINRPEFLTDFHERVMKEINGYQAERVGTKGKVLFAHLGQGSSPSSYKS